MCLAGNAQVADIGTMAEKAHEASHELKSSQGPAISSLEARMAKLEASAYPLSHAANDTKEPCNANEALPGTAADAATASAESKPGLPAKSVFANWTPAQEHLVKVCDEYKMYIYMCLGKVMSLTNQHFNLNITSSSDGRLAERCRSINHARFQPHIKMLKECLSEKHTHPRGACQQAGAARICCARCLCVASR